MLIDDDTANNFLNKMFLTNYDSKMNIIEFLNGKDALIYLKNSENKMPDLILLDINMPIMNGFEFLEQYQNLDCNITLNMLTTSVDDRDYDKAKLFSKVNNYYTKPLNNDVINEMIISLDNNQF